MMEELTGLSRADMCIFGDRLYTDIATGRRHGMLSVLVLTGETQKEDVESAGDADKPDLLFPSLAEVSAAIFGA